MENPLIRIHKVFDNEDFTSEIQSESEEIPFEHIKLSFDADTDSNFSYTLIVSYESHEELGEIFTYGNHYDLIQIRYLFPFQVNEEDEDDSMRVTELVNKVSPVAGFGYDETDRRCFFRYVIVQKAGFPSFSHILPGFELIRDVLNIYAPTISQVADGSIDLENLIDSINDQLFEDLDNFNEFNKS